MNSTAGGRNLTQHFAGENIARHPFGLGRIESGVRLLPSDLKAFTETSVFDYNPDKTRVTVIFFLFQLGSEGVEISMQGRCLL